MRAHGLCVLAGAALVFAGCSDPRSEALEIFQKIGAAPLRQDAARFYKDLYVAPPARFYLPRPGSWPAGFQRLRPLRVRAYPDGFAVAVREARGLEEGFYIVPHGMDRSPRETRTAHFERIDDGIYWYAFTD